MYESFFGLTSKPFTLNPDPRFFFRSAGHKRALAYMRYGLQQEQGFIVVTGDVGTGKTMLVNNLFREIEDQALVAAKIVSSNVKDVDLLRLIAAEFDVPFESSSKASLLHDLEHFFKQCRDEGKRVLLVIDEAQNLPRSALEELRMLSNFDYQGLPLVQSFLLGQREFRGIMRAPGLEQLRQRVIAAYHLKPLSHEEVKSYIEHRMRKAGWANDPVIEEG
ncbi:MAG: AAA family ATPase, partial [Gammaproteobacteria bacterium]